MRYRRGWVSPAVIILFVGLGMRAVALLAGASSGVGWLVGGLGTVLTVVLYFQPFGIRIVLGDKLILGLIVVSLLMAGLGLHTVLVGVGASMRVAVGFSVIVTVLALAYLSAFYYGFSRIGR